MYAQLQSLHLLTLTVTVEVQYRAVDQEFNRKVALFVN